MTSSRLTSVAADMRAKAKAATPGPWERRGTCVDASATRAVADCYDAYEGSVDMRAKGES